MTPSDLKYNYEVKVNGYYFTRSSMKFFGDTMSNYGCRKTTINNNHKVYELHRKKPVKNGLQNSVFFDRKTFEQVRIKCH